MIIALMIMIVLTLLGVTFLVLAEQEQQIAVNERDLTQVLYAAEAGVEVAKTWFNQPDAATNPFKPAAADLTLSLRAGQNFDLQDAYTNVEERSAPGNNVTGNYLGGGGITFEKEYRGTDANTFWGRRDTPDVLVCLDGEDVDLDDDGVSDCSSAVGGYMSDLNDAIVSLPSGEHSDRDFGDVSVQQIRVYRPPLDYTLRTRYGVATIESIAVKKVRGGRIVTERSVRDVIQEIPFPGPGGAIETESTVEFGGSAGVHWGPVVSSAFDDASDDIELVNPNSANFPDAAVPRDTPSRWGFHHTLNPASGHDLSDGGALPNSQAFTALTELLGLTANGVTPGKKGFDPIEVQDPWLMFRARNEILTKGASIGAGSHPHPYESLPGTVSGAEFRKGEEKVWSHMFQRQIVRFPPIDYDTWKEIVRSGQGGMFYMTHAGGNNYRLNGSGGTRTFTDWVQRDTGLGPGVYFFETTDNIAPHDDDADGVPDNLTPQTQFENGYMEGFALLYSSSFTSKGVGGGTPVDINMPAEVFLDDGIDLHDGTGPGDDCICIRFDADTSKCVLGLAPIDYKNSRPNCGPAATDCKCDQTTLDAMDPDVALRETKTFRDGTWSVDLNNDGEVDGDVGPGSPGWATFAAAPDAEGLKGHAFGDEHLPHYPIARSLEAGKFNTDWKRDPRFLNNAVGGFSPSDRQPHEPFVNFKYPSTGTGVGGIGDWGDHGLITDFDAAGDPSACEYAPNDRDCVTITDSTTVGRDAKGALMELDLHINGVLYCEGFYTGDGNMKVYGSMMMRGGYDGSGSLDVWFNESLVNGQFPPAQWELPRVFTSARDTD